MGRTRFLRRVALATQVMLFLNQLYSFQLKVDPKSKNGPMPLTLLCSESRLVDFQAALNEV